MPFLRLITFSFVLVIFSLALFGTQNHPWFTDSVLRSAALFAFCVWLMSLKKDFFLNVMALFFSAFFLQRIVVIYFRPDQMSYQPHLEFTSQIFGKAILFCIAISLAILLGYYFAVFLKKNLQKQKKIIINYDTFFGIRYDFSRLLKLYSIFFYASMILEVILMFGFNVGVTALDFDRQYAPLLRIVQIVQGLYFLPIIILTSDRFSPGTRNTALWMSLFILINYLFLQASKAAVLSLCIAFFICLHFSGKKIIKKYVILGSILFVLTIFILAPLTTMLRAGLVGVVTDSIHFSDVFSRLINNYTLTVETQFFDFMSRMGIFDWLTGFMTVGRDAFLPTASISNDLIGIVNSLVPGDLIATSTDSMTISKLMPHILGGREWGSYPGHGENMGGVGMAYLYFDTTGGVLFFFIWSFISGILLNSNTSIVNKVLYFTYFVFSFFLGGDLTSSIRQCYEGLLMFALFSFVTKRIRNNSAVHLQSCNN
jgi:hypothetical protein